MLAAPPAAGAAAGAGAGAGAAAVLEQVLLPELEQVLPLLLVQELRPDLLLQLHMSFRLQ